MTHKTPDQAPELTHGEIQELSFPTLKAAIEFAAAHEHILGTDWDAGQSGFAPKGVTSFWIC